jgi:flagellar basal body-associated protein FliL
MNQAETDNGPTEEPETKDIKTQGKVSRKFVILLVIVAICVLAGITLAIIFGVDWKNAEEVGEQQAQSTTTTKTNEPVVI